MSKSKLLTLPKEPKTLFVALKCEHSAQWKQAMDEEINSLFKNRTWDLTTLSSGRTTVSNKRTYKFKVKSDGSIDRFKARLVAKGYTQQYGVDYEETCAPTTKSDSIRTLLSIATSEDCEIVQFDIKMAFLHGDLSKTIYMDLPDRYSLLDSYGKVCLLRKSLYGLKQASQEWNKKFYDFLQTYELKQTAADPYVFYSTIRPILATIIFVDDGLAICKEKPRLTAMIEYLQTNFDNHYNGRCRHVHWTSYNQEHVHSIYIC